MTQVKRITFDFESLEDLLNILHGYWISAVQNQNMSREELYRFYLVKKFYEKTRRRQDNMVSENRRTIKVRFDLVHAVLMVDVLQRTAATRTTQNILFHLGSMCPSQMQKV